MIRNLFFIAAGGAIGSVLRYLTSLWTLKLIGQNWFFTGTTAANIIGCFLIGIIATILQEKGLIYMGFQVGSGIGAVWAGLSVGKWIL